MRDKNKETIVPLILIRLTLFFSFVLIDSDIPSLIEGKNEGM